MPYISTNYESFKGRVLADGKGQYLGECVSYVKQCCPNLGATPSWKKGLQVRVTGAGLKPKAGTVIATFDKGGRYTGHAAIYVSQGADGLHVWDQWKGHPVAPRTIAFRKGKGRPVNDGDQYFVVQ